MKFTSAMETAYQRGREMSRSQQAHNSAGRTRSPIRRILEHAFGERTGVLSVFRRPPEDLIAAYSSEDEGLAFVAGWIDGVVHNFNMRATIEDNVSPKLAF